MLITTLVSLLAASPVEVSGMMLYFLHKGDIEQGLSCYLDYVKESACHDYELLKQAAVQLLEKGAESSDPEIKLLCMLGAGVAGSSDLLAVLAKGIKSNELKTQLVALGYLAKHHDVEAEGYLLEALSSPFLITRLEALFQLAKRNHPATLNHLLSLSVKVPSALHTAFSQIAIHIENEEGGRYLHRLLTDPDSLVRIATIHSIAEAQRDDFLPSLAALAAGASPGELEAIASALGTLKDHSSINRLKELAQWHHETVALAGSCALYELGDDSSLGYIIRCAEEGSLFAIDALAQIEEGKETLAALLSTSSRDVRLNAAIALLNQKDVRALDGIKEILFPSVRDWGFSPIHSAGSTFNAWKSIPSSSQQMKHYPELKAQTQILREKLLMQCIELPEEEFLTLAKELFDRREHSLVPLLVSLLENRKSPKVIELLKQESQRAGAPFIRHYCTLALFRLKIEGPYESQLISWIKESAAHELIRFKEETDSSHSFNSPYQLIGEESSRLLIDALEAVVVAQNAQSIDILLHLIAYGNPKNRYALAGLLLRAAE